MRCEFHSSALVELTSAAEYYESRQPGLGYRFIDLVDEAVARIASDPFAWTPIDEDIRRCLTRIFPYGILYTVERDHVLTLAVAHLSREPEYWNPQA